MSGTRTLSKPYLIENGESKPAPVESSSFLAKGQVWSDEIVFQDADLPRLEALPTERLVAFDSEAEHEQAWNGLMKGENLMNDKVALYRTEGNELGVKAIAEIKAGESLIYAGEWEFFKGDLHRDVVYAADILKNGKAGVFGSVNARNRRNYASFVNHAPYDRKDLDSYEFKKKGLKAKIASANLLLTLIKRPKSSKDRQPFIMLLTAGRNINVDEVLVQDYGPEYFLQHTIQERFYYAKGGALVDASLHACITGRRLRVYMDQMYYFFDVMLSNEMVKNPTDTGTTNSRGTFSIGKEEIRAAMARYPDSQFFVIHNLKTYVAKPLSITENSSTTYSTSANAGKTLRNNAFSKSVSVKELDKYLRDLLAKLGSKLFLILLNTPGPESGLNPLDRAMQAGSADKMALLKGYGAKDKGELAEEKGEYDFLEALKTI